MVTGRPGNVIPVEHFLRHWRSFRTICARKKFETGKSGNISCCLQAHPRGREVFIKSFLFRVHERGYRFLKPEPLHHDKGIFAICVVAPYLEDILVALAPIEPLGGKIGFTHFQLRAGSAFDHELLLEAVEQG